MGARSAQRSAAAAQDAPAPADEAAAPEAAAPEAAESPEIEQLKQYAALKDQGILTEEEFAAKNRLVQPTGKRLKGSLENGFKPETRTSLRLFVEENNCFSRNGPNFSWRITPSRPCECPKPTRLICEP